MALTIDYTTLRREIGSLIGYKSNTSNWTADEIQTVQDILDRGLSRFYWPPPTTRVNTLGNEVSEPPHQWSFLTPDKTLSTVSGTSKYDLPSDFVDFNSKGFTYSAAGAQTRVARVDIEELDNLQANSARSGPPLYFSIRLTVLPNTTTYSVDFYPTPDASYVLGYSYVVTPDSLNSTTNQYPLGGPRHSATIMEACLAEAERRLNDGETFHEQRFKELLVASVAADKSLVKPEGTAPWPLENSATDLKVNKAYLKRLIGQQLGFGPHPGLWDNTQAQKVKLTLETGLRKFYAPRVLPGERYAHSWSFLKAKEQLTLVEDVYRYDLPEGFAMFKGDELIYEPGSALLYPPVKLVSDRQVDQNLQRAMTAGRPQICAYRNKPYSEATGTRFELILWPIPDQALTLNYRYSVNPGMLSDDAALPYGHQTCMQALVEACLCAAEEQSGQLGLHSNLFLECLQAAVGEDRKVNSPDTLGYNRDNSDRPMDPGWSWHDGDENLVTYTGLTP